MTRQRHDDKGSPFSDWLRVQPEIGSHTFSAQNLDFVWHNYRDSWFMLIEEKTHGGMQNRFAEMAQKDTHGVLHQMLEAAMIARPSVQTLRGKRPVDYLGYHTVVFPNTGPLDSPYVCIDGERKSIDELLRMLKTGEL